jgi:hypothetical protein
LPNGGHVDGLGKVEIDGYSRLAVVSGFQASPTDDAAAILAKLNEIEHEPRI